MTLLKKGNSSEALSGDFQHVHGKIHTQIPLGMRWCTMCIFLFLRFYNFIKGIACINIVFLKKTTIIIRNLLTCSNIYIF